MAAIGIAERTNAAVAEIETLSGVPQNLGVKLDQEGTDGVLIGLRHATPQRVSSLHNCVPLGFGSCAALCRQTMRQQRLDSNCLQQE